MSSTASLHGGFQLVPIFPGRLGPPRWFPTSPAPPTVDPTTDFHSNSILWNPSQVIFLAGPGPSSGSPASPLAGPSFPLSLSPDLTLGPGRKGVDESAMQLKGRGVICMEEALNKGIANPGFTWGSFRCHMVSIYGGAPHLLAGLVPAPRLPAADPAKYAGLVPAPRLPAADPVKHAGLVPAPRLSAADPVKQAGLVPAPRLPAADPVKLVGRARADILLASLSLAGLILSSLVLVGPGLLAPRPQALSVSAPTCRGFSSRRPIRSPASLFSASRLYRLHPVRAGLCQPELPAGL